MKLILKNRRFIYLLIHIIVWALFLFFPILMDWGSNMLDWSEYLRRLPVPLSFMAIFYINYCWLIDAYLFRRQQTKTFILINAVIIITICGSIHIKNEICRHLDKQEISIFTKDSDSTKVTIHKDRPERKHPIPHEFRQLEEKEPHFHLRMVTLFILRDVMSLALTIALAVSIKMTRRWYAAEASRRELEKSKTEAELKNLKNQLNPHFLLNTLNNIYALIAFNSDKAQKAVQDLSKLLRYVLYENQENYVPLAREVEFIRNYIELMKIRLNDNVTVKTSFKLIQGSSVMIAPLIFISLIENAFKHGTSATEDSFIDISLEERMDGTVICRIVNSHYPKTDMDKSGSGIGLEQVRKRLELLYPGQYIWQRNVSEDRQTYESMLIISTHKIIES